MRSFHVDVDTSLKLCPHCDAVYVRAPLSPDERAYCRRCGGELYRNHEVRIAALLPLVFAGFITYVTCNVFPIVTLEIQGLSTQTTVWGAVRAMAHHGMWPVATLVLATTTLVPFLELGLLTYLLASLAAGRVPVGFGPIVRFMRVARPWGMVEVFLLGIVASMVKLSAMATVVPGPALWAFGALVALLAIVIVVDPADFWEYAAKVASLERARAAEEARTAEEFS
mgnify:CR=1 FL=1